MKTLKILSLITVFTIVMLACNQTSKNEDILQKQIDDLQQQLQQTYKPGIGDLMGNIQKHHNKLWFAGINGNWELAEFAIHEIEEGFEYLKTFQGHRDEMKTLAMINPSLEKLKKTITIQDEKEFKEGYMVLSETCNACHSSTGFNFIKIIPPSQPSLSNQEYKPTN